MEIFLVAIFFGLYIPILVPLLAVLAERKKFQRVTRLGLLTGKQLGKRPYQSNCPWFHKH